MDHICLCLSWTLQPPELWEINFWLQTTQSVPFCDRSMNYHCDPVFPSVWEQWQIPISRWVCELNETHISKAPNMVSGTKDSKRPCTPWPLLAHLHIRSLEIPAVGITQALIGPFTTGIKWTIPLNWCPKNNQEERESRTSPPPRK